MRARWVGLHQDSENVAFRTSARNAASEQVWTFPQFLYLFVFLRPAFGNGGLLASLDRYPAYSVQRKSAAMHEGDPVAQCVVPA